MIQRFDAHAGRGGKHRGPFVPPGKVFVGLHAVVRGRARRLDTRQIRRRRGRGQTLRTPADVAIVQDEQRLLLVERLTTGRVDERLRGRLALSFQTEIIQEVKCFGRISWIAKLVLLVVVIRRFRGDREMRTIGEQRISKRQRRPEIVPGGRRRRG